MCKESETILNSYDAMIYDFFMLKKRNIKVIGIQDEL